MRNIIIAFLIDILIGDPVYRLHPIRLMGDLIHLEEKWFLKEELSDYDKYIRGTVIAIFNIVFVFGLTIGIIVLIPKGFFRELFKIFLIYSAISLGDLGKSARKVRDALELGLIEARHELSMIVGRDTQNLDEEGIVKATVETVAENTSDGVISPLFYAFFLGAPGAMAMKMVNTMDSMIGYKNAKYLYYGKFAAILDDAVNYLPARITALMFLLAGDILNLNVRNARYVLHRDAKKHESLNAGYPESVMAGLLGVRLLGPASYNGAVENKPYVGNNFRRIEKDDIYTANRVMYVAGAFFVLICLFFEISGLKGFF